MVGLFEGWTRSEYLELISICISVVIAFTIYLLQRRLSDKQKVENRLEIEAKAGEKLREIRGKKHSSKVHLYNVKLIDKRYFSSNKRNLIWGLPYHAASLYAINFDGIEFALGVEEWGDQKYDRVGVVPFERILDVRLEGDGSFNGPIFYVRPRLFQRDKYSIAYKSFRYYPIKGNFIGETKKPLQYRIRDGAKKSFGRAKYYSYYKWKHALNNKSKK